MARTKIKLNSAGVLVLLNDDRVRAMLTGKMERVLDAAKAGAPVNTGAYRDGLHIVQATTDRAAVRVVSGDFKGHIIEAKTGNLARALDAAGGA